MSDENANARGVGNGDPETEQERIIREDRERQAKARQERSERRSLLLVAPQRRSCKLRLGHMTRTTKPQNLLRVGELDHLHRPRPMWPRVLRKARPTNLLRFLTLDVRLRTEAKLLPPQQKAPRSRPERVIKRVQGEGQSNKPPVEELNNSELRQRT